VPIWASFMKTATKGAKPDWFERPANVVGVNVCRVSGKLPNGGCSSVEVVNRDGLMETRSMIYTEYFVKGTQPTELCPLHESPSFMDRIAGLFGAGESPGTPVHADQVGLPPARAGTSGARATLPDAPAAATRDREQPNDKAEDKAEGAPKKRGFWGRLFGRGDKKEDSKKKKDGGA
jgi:hypothetical protein